MFILFSRKKEDKEDNDMSFDNKTYICIFSTTTSRHEQSLNNQVITGSPSDYPGKEKKRYFYIHRRPILYQTENLDH